ncbi:folic acid synthesis protein-like protein [Xylogone sp. PMI_703]|nr:folic acid synthesis protein-like protein [Xylogone sp. PMI_703]
MRSIHYVFRRGASLSRSIHSVRRVEASGLCSMLLARRYSSSPRRMSTNSTPWSQYTLNNGSNKPDIGSSMPSSKSPMKRTAYIALGSNLGDRVAMIERACKEMETKGIKIKKTSSLWETEPMYVLDQDTFLNGACEVETTLEPFELLDELQGIENIMGRKKVIDKGPRNIDLDILLYEDEIVDSERLKIPHPLMLEREFVLRPLAEVAPRRPLDQRKPWKLPQDYLYALQPSSMPMSTITPLQPDVFIHALSPTRTTQVMAIINVTPDSFSDGGLHSQQSLPSVIQNSIASGATILDIGGQSSAPYAPDITPEEEIARVVPAITAIRKIDKNVIISIDTYRASVAEAAVHAGADIVNDISSGQLDPDMLPTVAKLGKTICLMHMRGTPATMPKLTNYSPDGLIPTVASELLERISEAEQAGIRRWRIILDPGIGFAKNQSQNLEILRHLEELRSWPGLEGLPWLVGSSRKGFIGRITGVEEPAKRTYGTAATVAAAVQGGADIVRVHDVEEMRQVVKVSDAIWRA